MRRIALGLLMTALFAAPATAQTLDRIRAKGEINIGYRTDAAPLSFADSGGNPTGYSIKICKAIVAAMAQPLELEKIKTNFIPVTTEDRFDKVASGDVDLLCGASTITLSRRVKVDFSTPTFIDGTAVLLLRDASGDMSALDGKKIGVRKGTTTEKALGNSLKRAGVNGEVVAFDNHQAAMAAMEAGEIEAHFADQSILYNLFSNSELQNKFKISNEILTVEKHGLVMARGDADMRLLVDTILSRLYSSGEMSKLYRKSFPTAQPGLAMRAMYLIAPTLP
ncbi:amino acid ABC transporter substrate-binding protein [Roseovarius sp. EL26]|uniref:amino acid ABC transporter substrate-binding protein n=1 Tax=Roseovarius sp. EL26 TaxID=2126672 RepID=UPI000EA2C3DA|nr:amino acid ABC transporter substrate-binding protein [Roseovarius sp. EL26]